MRHTIIPLFLICFFWPFQKTNAQAKNPPKIDVSWMGKAHSWDVFPDFRAVLDHENVAEDGQRIGTETDIRVGVGAYYFFTNHWAAGLGLDLTSTHTTSTGAITGYSGTSTETTWSLNPGLEYGFNLGSSVGMYLRGSVGFGDNRTSGTGSNSSLFKQSIFSFGGQIGFPILLQESPVKFTPFVSYLDTKYSFVFGKETNFSFGVGVRLESFIGGGEFVCDGHHGYSLSRNAFRAGQNFFSYSNEGSLSFGSQTSTYFTSGASNPPKINFVDDCVDICYGHFFVSGLAIGAQLNIRSNADTYVGQDQKITTSSWQLGPIVEYHPFDADGLRPFALKGGIGFGGDKTKSQFPGTGIAGSTSTETYFGYNFGINYVDYLAPSIALVPEVGYRGNTLKYNFSGNKDNNNGPYVGWGLRYSF